MAKRTRNDERRASGRGRLVVASNLLQKKCKQLGGYVGNIMQDLVSRKELFFMKLSLCVKGFKGANLSSVKQCVVAGLAFCGLMMAGFDQAGPGVSMVSKANAEPAELVVYSARKDHLIRPLFDEYTKQTGVKITFTTDKAGALLARLKAEGARTPADVLLTVDAGNLWQAAEAGLLKPLDSKTLTSNVPAHLRDPQGRWFGLSKRARTIVYKKGKVDPAELSTYAALGDEKFKGRLCLRTSKKVYNQSLVAAMIERNGVEATEKVVKRWVDNLAVDVFSSDTQLIEAMVSGPCEVGVVNTYYLGRLQRDNPDLPVGLYWPNQKDSGVHVNVSGGGVVKHSDQPAAAQALLEWLSSADAQAKFAGFNLEYPVTSSVALDPIVKAWGDFKEDEISVARYGALQSESVKLMDRAGYR